MEDRLINLKERARQQPEDVLAQEVAKHTKDDALRSEEFFYYNYDTECWCSSEKRIGAEHFTSLLSLPPDPQRGLSASASSGAVRNAPVCYEYCIQVLADKPVVRLRMSYIVVSPAPCGYEVRDAWFMVNTHIPQSAAGCGTFFSEKLEQGDVVKPPAPVMRRMQMLLYDLIG